MRRVAVLGMLLALMSVASPSRGEPEPAEREAARTLGNEGVELFEKGDFASALDRFERAHGVLRAPTLALYSARCLVKLGRWVEGSARYSEATAIPLDAFSQVRQHEIQKQAQADAEAERVALVRRIPVLIATVRGASEAEVVVTLDGRPAARELLDHGAPVDLGEHRIVAEADGRRVEVSVVVTEAETRRLSLDFPSSQPTLPAGKPRATPTRRKPPGAAARPAPPVGDDSGGSLQRTLGWASIGLGGALIGGGAGGHRPHRWRGMYARWGCAPVHRAEPESVVAVGPDARWELGGALMDRALVARSAWRAASLA